MASTLAAVREVTSLVRSPHEHGCKPVEVVPGVWTAHYHDIDDETKLKSISSSIKTVVNCATDKCPTKDGSYGTDVEVMRVEGLLDDPDERKKLDSMAEGPEKEAARGKLPQFPAEKLAGNAKKDFETVVAAMEKTHAAGGATMVHCYASLSRSVAFILAYMMKTQKITVVEAARQMKTKWSATWPNDSFVEQLLEYEKELGLAGTPGVVDMKVTTKKSAGFYIKSATSFLTGVDSKDGSKKEPVCVLNISGVGEACNIAAAAATAVESAGLGYIQKIETSYPDLQGRGTSHGCARIVITVYHK